LAQDPRPAYQHDPERVYKLQYSDFEVHFSVADKGLYVKDLFRYKNG
jgi:hypothetical protein